MSRNGWVRSPVQSGEPMVLRHYQSAAVDAVRDAARRGRNPLVVMPTGTGKTVVFAELIRSAEARVGGRTLVLAHRAELLEQAAAKLAAVGVEASIERADLRASDDASCVVASVQSMARKRRLERFPRDHFRRIVIDEAHHAPADTYRRVVDHFQASVAGFTATPDRLDKRGLGGVFDEIAYRYDLRQAIADGWLAPIVQQRVVVEKLDLSRIRTTRGDLDESALAAVMRQAANLHGIAVPLLREIGDRRTLVFAVNVAHAEALTAVINRYRPGTARMLAGRDSDADRAATLSAFAAAEFQVLVNCALLTEGFDDPGIACVAMARPTKSRALYAQAIGRGTRLHPGKGNVLILDFVGNSGRHNLVTAVDLLTDASDSERTVAVAKEIANADPALTVDQALARARELGVTALAKYRLEGVDPFTGSRMGMLCGYCGMPLEGGTKARRFCRRLLCKQERSRARRDVAGDKSCTVCNEPGHNVVSCPKARGMSVAEVKRLQRAAKTERARQRRGARLRRCSCGKPMPPNPHNRSMCDACEQRLERRCVECGAALERGPREPLWRFAQRRTCSRSCAASAAAEKARATWALKRLDAPKQRWRSPTPATVSKVCDYLDANGRPPPQGSSLLVQMYRHAKAYAEGCLSDEALNLYRSRGCAGFLSAPKLAHWVAPWADRAAAEAS